MIRIHLSFKECKHFTDLENYMKDVKACDGDIGVAIVADETERGYIEVGIKDLYQFVERFKKTRACRYSNLASYTPPKTEENVH
jgi:hypothetical protein